MFDHRELSRALDAVISSSASADRIVALDALQAVVHSTLHSEVARARSDGVTWAAIGRELGVTRQAAFQRFAPKTAESVGKGGTMLTQVLQEAPERAADVVRAIAESRAGDATSFFGADAAAALTPERLTSVWADVKTSFGELEEASPGSALVMGEHVVVDMRLEFEAGSLVYRTSWDAQGELAGLFFLPVPE